MATAEGTKTPIEPGLIARVVSGVRYAITGKPNDFFGPGQPLLPAAPQAVGRQFDYPVGFNTRVTPRAEEQVTFAQMRCLADNYDVLRLVIETRKDQMCIMPWSIKPIDEKAEADDRCDEVVKFLRKPDQEHTWQQWLRMLLEDLYVIDAPCIYPRATMGGGLYALELVDGALIKRVIDQTGRTPVPPDPAYQQVIKGLPAVNYTREELIYSPRNPRTNRLYGYSPVEQIIMTVNIAMRRQLFQLQYYTEGNVPEALISTPETWNPDQIRQFQNWFDSLLEGNTAQRRKAKFIPFGVEYHETKAGVIGDKYDEWLARVICFAFSIAPTPFIAQNNRATAQTAQQTALSEGLMPTMEWVKSVLDDVVQNRFGYEDLQFTWSEPDVTDAETQAEIDVAYVGAKIKTADEIRDDLGLEPLTDDQKAELNPPPPPGLGGVDENGNPLPTAKLPPGKLPPGKAPPAKLPVAAQGKAELVKKKKQDIQPINRDRPAATAAMAKIQRAVSKQLHKWLLAVQHGLRRLGKDELSDESKAQILKEALAAINATGATVLIDDMTQILEDLVKDSGAEALVQVGIGDDSRIVNLVNQFAVTWARDRAAEMVGMKYVDDELVPNPDAEWRIDESTRDLLRGDVGNALQHGWSNDHLADQLENVYAFSGDRSETIARTETANADVQGNLNAWKESGLVVGKEWITAAGCCDECQDLDGVIVDIDDDFPDDGDDGPPLHPNCRCDIKPVLADDSESGD